MKNLSLFIFSVLLSQHVFGQFQVCNSPTHQSLQDVFFINKTLGVAVGDSGTIVRSIDGGENWDLVMVNDTVYFRTVKFFDARNAIAVGSDIYVSRDSGESWTAVPHPNRYFTDIEILNPTTCLISGEPTALIKSIDMGATFSTLVAQQGPNSEYGLLSFVDENMGYSCSFSGGFSTRTLKTIDGGTNWTAIEDTLTRSNPTIMEALSFVSEDIGFKGGWYNGHLQQTTNGANQWEYCALVDSNAYPQLLDFHIEANVPYAYYACGWYGQIFKSVNGGGSWRELNSGVNNTTSLYGIFFIDANTGWVVGQNGTILKTTSGGVVLGIDDLNQTLSITTYPNPVQGIIHIENPDNYLIKSIELLGLNGQSIATYGEEDLVNVGGLSAGVYFLKIHTNKGVHIEKVVKE